jgi:hypothetical protein
MPLHIVWSTNSAISCFSVLCQFKIVKPTRQPGKKHQQNLENKTASLCCMKFKHKLTKKLSIILFHLSTKEILNKQKI